MTLVYIGLLVVVLAQMAKPFASRKWGKLASTKVVLAIAVTVFLSALIGAVLSGNWIPAIVAGYMAKEEMDALDRLEAAK